MINYTIMKICAKGVYDIGIEQYDNESDKNNTLKCVILVIFIIDNCVILVIFIIDNRVILSFYF